MTLIKTSLLSLIATFFKMLSGLVINKAISVYIGPAGLAVIGQFQNFSQVVLIAAQGAINSGVVKYTAEYGKDSPKIPHLFSTALRISLVASILVGFIIALFSSFFSRKILDNIDYSFVFVIFGFTIILFVLNGLLLSILNGLKEIRNYIKINIIQSLYSLVFTSLLIYFFSLKGALIALATNQSIIFFITLAMIKRHDVIKWKNFTSSFDKHTSNKLFAFSAMAITSAIMAPTSQFIIRDYITTTQGLEQAGYWQGVWYISTIYLMVVTTALSTYYLPRLSEISDLRELRKEIFQGYKILLPIVITCGLLIYLLRDFIISILFTDDFIPMKSLFMWQIFGDIFKIAAWLLAYIMLAKSMVKEFILSEVVFSLSIVIFSYLFIFKYGTIGATYAYFLNYVVYFITMYFFIFKNLTLKK